MNFRNARRGPETLRHAGRRLDAGGGARFAPSGCPVFRRVVAFLALIFLVAPFHGSAAEPVQPPCCRAVAPNTPITDKSLFQLESTWTSDQDKQVKLSVLHGRPQVVALFFTRCEFACPIIVHDLRRLEAALPQPLRGKIDFLLVSLDSERDTVAALRAFRELRKLPLANWTLLRGAHDDVRELAALLGVNYQRDARGQFAHSNLITVLNAAGEIIHQQVGLNQEPTETIKALNKTMEPAPAEPGKAAGGNRVP